MFSNNLKLPFLFQRWILIRVVKKKKKKKKGGGERPELLLSSSLEMDDTKSSHLIMMDDHSSLLGKTSHLPHKAPPSRLLEEKEGSLLSKSDNWI